MTAPQRCPRLPWQLDAGPLERLIGSFALHLTAEGKAARTVQSYTSAVRWFAASYLADEQGKTRWEQVDGQDIQRWMIHLLDRYSGAYASIQFRALRQFFKWQAAEEDLPDPMVRLRAPKVTVTAVPVFTSVELSELEKACQAARSLDRYLRARARHAEAWRPQLWLGVNNRGPLTPTGIYQIVARRGRQAGVNAYPHRFRHHFSHTWLDRGGAERDLMELNGWASPQMLTRYGASARGARARRSYDRIMNET